jgi:hypothetical protein
MKTCCVKNCNARAEWACHFSGSLATVNRDWCGKHYKERSIRFDNGDYPWVSIAYLKVVRVHNSIPNWWFRMSHIPKI